MSIFIRPKSLREFPFVEQGESTLKGLNGMQSMLNARKLQKPVIKANKREHFNEDNMINVKSCSNDLKNYIKHVAPELISDKNFVEQKIPVFEKALDFLNSINYNNADNDMTLEDINDELEFLYMINNDNLTLGELKNILNFFNTSYGNNKLTLLELKNIIKNNMQLMKKRLDFNNRELAAYKEIATNCSKQYSDWNNII